MGRVAAPDIMSVFASFSLPYLLLFLGVAFLVWIVLSYRWHIITEALGYRVPLRRLLEYGLMGFPASYLIPSAGAASIPVKVMMLKRHDMSNSEALSSVLLDGAFDSSMTVILMLFSALYLSLIYQVSLQYLLILVLAALLFVSVLFVFYIRMAEGKACFPVIKQWGIIRRAGFLGRVMAAACEMESIMMRFFRFSRQILLKTALLTLLSTGLYFLQIKIAMSILGQDVALFQIPVIISFALGASLIPVPAGLGFLEAGQYSAFIALGMSPSIGIALALILRLRDFLYVLLGLIILSSEGISFLAFINKGKK